MSDEASKASAPTSTPASTQSSSNPTDKQAVTSDNPKSAWDQVGAIDWGDQLDDLKQAAASTDKPADTTTSTDKPAEQAAAKPTASS